MNHLQKIHDLYDAPHNLDELLHTCLAYIEQVIWRRQNRFLYATFTCKYGKQFQYQRAAWSGHFQAATHLPCTDLPVVLGYTGIHLGRGSKVSAAPVLVNNNLFNVLDSASYDKFSWRMHIFADDWPSIALADMFQEEKCTESLTHYSARYINPPHDPDRLALPRYKVRPSGAIFDEEVPELEFYNPPSGR